MAQGAETSGRGWRGTGVDDVQVDGILLQEKRWGEGETRGGNDENRILMGGGRSEGKKKQKKLIQVGRIGVIISVKH